MIQTHGAKLARLGAQRQVFSEKTAHLRQAGVSLVWGHGKSFSSADLPVFAQGASGAWRKEIRRGVCRRTPMGTAARFFNAEPVRRSAGSGRRCGHDCGPLCNTEWLEEKGGALPLMPSGGLARAEVRRLIAWLTTSFTARLAGSLPMRKSTAGSWGQCRRRRAGYGNRAHRAAQSGPAYGISDISSGTAQLAGGRGYHHCRSDGGRAFVMSGLYGDVPWKSWPVVRDWYARIKSRPSFRPLLADTVAGMRPPAYYADLDF